MTCELCRRTQKDGFKKIRCEGIERVATCPEGEVAKLLPENNGFWFLFQRVLPGLRDAFGGFNYDALGFIFDRFNVPKGWQQVMIDKAIAVITAMEEIREAERDKS